MSTRRDYGSESTYVSMEKLVEQTQWYLKFLRENDIDPNPTSEFMRDVNEVRCTFQSNIDSIRPTENSINQLRALCGISAIANMVHRARKNSTFPLARAYSHELENLDIPWNVSKRRTPKRDKTWELIVACIVSCFCRNVTRNEPDIVATYGDNIWGIACKVLYSSNATQNFAQIIKAIEQIEKSSADFGCVAVDLSPLIDHSKYLSLRVDNGGISMSRFENEEVPKEQLEVEIRGISKAIREQKLPERIRDKTRAIILQANTIFTMNRFPQILSHTHVLLAGKIMGPEHDFLSAYYRSRKEIASYQFNPSAEKEIVAAVTKGRK